MATINKKLIHFRSLSDFETRLAAGDILDTSIVYIQDAKKIWTHDTYYDCSGGSGGGLSESDVFSNKDMQLFSANGFVDDGGMMYGLPASSVTENGEQDEILATQSYVDNAISSAITNTLNTAV